MEHIRGRARGLSVFVLADMWAQPMIKLDHLYNLLLPGTIKYNYSYKNATSTSSGCQAGRGAPSPRTPLPIIRIKKRTCTPSTVVTGDIAAAVIQNTAIPENNTWIDVGWQPAQRPVLDTYSQPRLRGRWVIARIYR